MGVFGWNLIDENKNLFKHQLRGTFPDDIYKYYKIKTKKTLGIITEAELAWYNRTRKEQDFMKILKIFKSFIHGTHIAGIAVNNEGELSYLDIKYYPIRYLGSTKIGRWIEPKFTPLKKGKYLTRINHIKKYFSKYTSWQRKKWLRAIQLTHKNTEIINGSFGKSFKSVLKVAADKYKLEFDKDISQSLQAELARDFLNKLNTLTEQIANKYPQYLFVFSAGNSKANNDDQLHYPSNARAENIISVGASKQYNERAYFSNFGEKTVDIFAPGVAISSSIPTDRYLRVNGTSQAAPFISNVAAKALELAKKRNIKLSPAKLKTLILGTVDKKQQLLKQCQSGGIINPDRLFASVRLLSKYSLSIAIKKSLELITPISSIAKNNYQITRYLSDILIEFPLPEPF